MWAWSGCRIGCQCRRKKLIEGVRLRFLHTKLDARTCEDCTKWQYDNEGNRVERKGRHGPIPMPRDHAKHPTPCHECPKTEGQPIRTKQYAVKLSEKNEQALRHYLECRATGQFPDDLIVRRNASLIAPFVNAAENVLPMLTMVGKAFIGGANKDG